MMYPPKILINRVKDILRTRGLLSLLSRGFDFLMRYLFSYGKYYLYELAVKERDEADFMPSLQNLTVHIVSSNQQADELAASGFDFRSYSVYARRRLDKGATAVCTFVKQELASIVWVAMTEEAKNTIDSLPYQVDFVNKVACTGGTETIPKYRRKGLMKYGYYKIFQFLGEQGIVTSRNAVHTSNVASQKAHGSFGYRIYARARYLKILRWKSWKETPLVPASQSG
jgi:hypothetical protein